MAKKLTKIKLWYKKKHTPPVSEEVTCKNCSTVFKGNFCPECGQSKQDYDKPFSFIFYNFVGDFFSFDTRFFRTFYTLITKPGFLTTQYFEGKRIRYAPPFRIFIFISFVLFFLLQIFTNRGLNTVLESNLNGNAKLDSLSYVNVDSILTEVKAEIDSSLIHSSATDTDSNQSEITTGIFNPGKYDLNTAKDSLKNIRNLRDVLDQTAKGLEKDMGKTTDPKKKARLRKYIQLCRSPEQAIAKFLEYLSWAFFLLLPVFALILKLVYIRRKQNYIRHLVFSIHIHSFIFLLFTIVTGIFLLTGDNIPNISVSLSSELRNISVILFLSFPIYFIIALKKFYGQSWRKAILKFFVISFIYNTIFWVTVGVVFLNALSII